MSDTVIRPKSIATVVVVFVVTSPRLSIPMAAEVIGASVVNGVISEMESTKVVLPTAKPPAMTIFSGFITGPSPSDAGRLEGLEVIEQPFERGEVGAVIIKIIGTDSYKFVADQVAYKNTGDTQMYLKVCGYFCN